MNISSKQIQWVLDKALPDIFLSKQSITLDSDNLTDTFTITSNSDGNLSVVSSDDSIVTASLSGNTVTVEALANGSTTITVNVVESSNYLSESIPLSVNVSFASTTLNDNSWSTISQIAKAGTASNYWSIGDCKEITLNGKIGDHLTLSDTKLCVFILDINHPMNGVAENNIIFGGFKTALTDGVDVALADNSRNNNSGLIFNISHYGDVNGIRYSYGGWKGCDLRYDILGATSIPPSGYGSVAVVGRTGYDATESTLTNPKENTLLAALQSDLRSNMRLWTRWVDASGNYSNVEENIKATVDAITLLAVSEISAPGNYPNQYEYNHNTRMAYYTNGNGTIKSKYTNVSSAFWWWTCSPSKNSCGYFCYVNEIGNVACYNVSYAMGLAPAFKI